jgi:hypothetical protein
VEIEIKIDKARKKKKKPEKKPLPRKEVWPTMLNEDLPVGLETKINFFDAMTKLDPDTGEWIDVPEWTNDYKEPGEGESGDTDEDCILKERLTFTKEGRTNMPFHICPKDTTVKIYANKDSRPNKKVIVDEYGDQNEKRWDRKPFGTMAVDWMQDGSRWALGGMYEFKTAVDPFYVQATDMSMMNISVKLKKGKDVKGSDPTVDTAAPYAWIDPARYHEQKATNLKLTWDYNVDTMRPLQYHGYLGGTYGIEVKDLSKTFAHYVKKDDTDSEIKYTYDWIESAFFCPFDTTDIDPNDGNYKITREPKFDADDVTSGLIVDDDTFDIFMVPRRIAYHLYYRHHEKTTTTIDREFPTINCVCDESLQIWGGNGATITGPDHQDGHDDEIIKVVYDCSLSCSGIAPTPASTGTLHSRLMKSTHHVATWWGRIPHDFTPHNMLITDDEEDEHYHEAVHNTAPIKFYDDEGTDVGTLDVVWEETQEDAREHYVASGGEQKDADEIYSGGGSSFHVLRDETPYYVYIARNNSLNALWPCDAIRNTQYVGPPITREEDDNKYVGSVSLHDNDALGIKRIWQVIEDSKFWTDVIQPLRDKAINDSDDAMQSSRIDCIPYGIAISPSKEGSLVGVIRKGTGGNCWYIWRRKDEDFEDEDNPQLRTVKPEGETGSGKGHLSFQSRDADGGLKHFREPPYALKQYCYDIDAIDHFSGPGSRKLTKFGRDIKYTEGDDDAACGDLFKDLTACADGDGKWELDVPIYVMASKERAFDIEAEWKEGSNTALKCRLCRAWLYDPTDADTRNSF